MQRRTRNNLIAVSGCLLGPLIGGAVGIGVAYAIATYAVWKNPQDQTAGSVAIRGLSRRGNDLENYSTSGLKGRIQEQGCG